MIKVTEEMQLAFIEGKQASTWGPNTAYADGLAAVLAIVERDHCMEPKGHVFHPLRKEPS